MHPLSLPEIILLVGKFIPFWQLSDDPDELDVPANSSIYFEPEDLLSCVKVNRIWNQTLTPLLFQLYTSYSHDTESIPLPTLVQNMHHIRYLRLHQRQLRGKDAQQDYLIQHVQNLAELHLGHCLEGYLPLLERNMGCLRSLSLMGHWVLPVRMSSELVEVLEKMKGLEELFLEKWILTVNEFVRILSGAHGLRVLSLRSIGGLDDLSSSSSLMAGDGHGGGNDVGGTGNSSDMPGLERLVDLRILFDWSQSPALAHLPRFCLKLEKFSMEMDHDEHFSVPVLAESLRVSCPGLRSFRYKEGYSMAHEYGCFPDEDDYMQLVRGLGGKNSGLGSIDFNDLQIDDVKHSNNSSNNTANTARLTTEPTMKATEGIRELDMAVKSLTEEMTDAILVHARTLESLRLKSTRTTMDSYEIGRILQHCPRLRALKLLETNILEEHLLSDLFPSSSSSSASPILQKPESGSEPESFLTVEKAPVDIVWACKDVLEVFEIDWCLESVNTDKCNVAKDQRPLIYEEQGFYLWPRDLMERDWDEVARFGQLKGVLLGMLRRDMPRLRKVVLNGIEYHLEKEEEEVEKEVEDEDEDFEGEGSEDEG